MLAQMLSDSVPDLPQSSLTRLIAGCVALRYCSLAGNAKPPICASESSPYCCRRQGSRSQISRMRTRLLCSTRVQRFCEHPTGSKSWDILSKVAPSMDPLHSSPEFARCGAASTGGVSSEGAELVLKSSSLLVGSGAGWLSSCVPYNQTQRWTVCFIGTQGSGSASGRVASRHYNTASC